jgi:hypothetical protein
LQFAGRTPPRCSGSRHAGGLRPARGNCKLAGRQYLRLRTSSPGSACYPEREPGKSSSMSAPPLAAGGITAGARNSGRGHKRASGPLLKRHLVFLKPAQNRRSAAKYFIRSVRPLLDPSAGHYRDGCETTVGPKGEVAQNNNLSGQQYPTLMFARPPKRNLRPRQLKQYNVQLSFRGDAVYPIALDG